MSFRSFKFYSYVTGAMTFLATLTITSLAAQTTGCNFDKLFLKTDTVVVNKSWFSNWQDFKIVYEGDSSTISKIESELILLNVELTQAGERIHRVILKKKHIYRTKYEQETIFTGLPKIKINSHNELVLTVFRTVEITSGIILHRSKYKLSRGYYNFEVVLKCANNSMRSQGVLRVK